MTQLIPGKEVRLKNLKKRRERLGLTQAKLAHIAGVSYVTISNIENGKQEAQPSTRAAIESALEKAGEE